MKLVVEEAIVVRLWMRAVLGRLQDAASEKNRSMQLTCVDEHLEVNDIASFLIRIHIER